MLLRARGFPLPQLAAAAVLRGFAAQLSLRPRLRRWLRWEDGWIDFSIGFRTESRSIAQTLRVRGGRATVVAGVAPDVDTELVFRDESVALDLLRLPPNESLLLLMRGRMRARGNLSYLSLFQFLTSVLMRGRYRRLLAAQARERGGAGLEPTPPAPRTGSGEPLTAAHADGVRFLGEPYLARYTLADFPRLVRFLEDHHTLRAELCPERPVILTRWYREHGFEIDRGGRPWDPVLRQAHAFRHLMSTRAPRIRAGDLLAGTTTSKHVGVVLYPDAHGTLAWGELLTFDVRPLNPYGVEPETVRLLHDEVFPFWARRSFREWVRSHHDEPLCQQIDERFAVYFCWKTVALSHTVAAVPRLLGLGVRGLIAEIDGELGGTGVDAAKRVTLEALRISLEGLIDYARNLAAEARRQADAESDPARRAELARMATVCERVPEHPARDLHEALQSLWIAWIGLHLENTNAGLSLGRLDLWLEPYLDAHLAGAREGEERERAVRDAIELVGCFFLRCTDHLPLVPDVGNYLFGGSSSDQAITLGGVTRDGRSAVSDATYVLLKVTEMLRLRDPNVNARMSLARNDDAYLRRLAEVNLVTAATPSVHGDENVIRALADHGYAAEDARDWSAIGCVEPTISGQHFGHTGSMMFSLVAPLEMALHDGRHPLMGWKVGPATGDPAAGAFSRFEEFRDAYLRQLAFLVDQAVAYNNLLGEAHAELRPTPLLSALMVGPLTSGRDVTRGGARFNTSGVACVGLTDVVDSLAAIRRLVFDERRVGFAELIDALAADFVGFEALHARIVSRVPRFGSGDPGALELAREITACVHELFAAKRNARGGRYTTGFWSMSNHVAFGTLAGALPSGRRAGKAFTPGLTPAPGASRNLLDNLRDVAALEPRNLDNNVAFNVKYVPAPSESRAAAVDHVAAYVRGYFALGGLQMQLNVVSSATLRDAMANPEAHRDLLVRISGYNAYFVTLNRDMQIELIERAEFSG